MRADLRLCLVILALASLAAGCGGRSSSTSPIPKSVSESPNQHNPAETRAILSAKLIKRYIIGFAKGSRTPTFFKVENGQIPVIRRPGPRTSMVVRGITGTGSHSGRRFQSSLAPAPTPSPWCPASASGSANQWACGWLTPPDGYIDIDFSCTNCTAVDSNITTSISFDSTYTPPPNFVIETYGCAGNTCNSPSTCTYGAPCQSTACWQSTCYTETKLSVNEGAPPANVHLIQQSSTGAGYKFSPLDIYSSVTPDVLDLDIPSGDQIVSWPHPTPPPIIAGQEVQLQASPAADLTTATWTFDSSAPTDVVGSYGLLGPTPGPSPYGPSFIDPPSPAPSSGNPATFYWTNTGDWSTRHLYLNATANNVQGPLIVDIYYPVNGSTGGVLSINTANVDVGTDIVSHSTNCQNPTLVAYALHLGVGCSLASPPAPQPTPGFSSQWNFGQAANGSGRIAVAQLMYISYSGSKGATPLPEYQTDIHGYFQLDSQFPMYGTTVSVPAGGSASGTWPDSPFYNVGASSCSYFSTVQKFQDYYMYQPNPRIASHPSIWVPVLTIGWEWSGAAQTTNNLTWNLASPAPVNPNGSTLLNTDFPSWSTIPVLEPIC